MENRDPILLSRFEDESNRVRDHRMVRQYRISVALVAVLIAATLGTIASVHPVSKNEPSVVASSVVRQS